MIRVAHDNAIAALELQQHRLGLNVDATTKTLSLDNARLPVFLDHLRIEHLAVGDAGLDAKLERQHSGVGVEVLERKGSVSVVNVK